MNHLMYARWIPASAYPLPDQSPSADLDARTPRYTVLASPSPSHVNPLHTVLRVYSDTPLARARPANHSGSWSAVLNDAVPTGPDWWRMQRDPAFLSVQRWTALHRRSTGNPACSETACLFASASWGTHSQSLRQAESAPPSGPVLQDLSPKAAHHSALIQNAPVIHSGGSLPARSA
ncbi:hypothetical protein D1872_196200 [compost metagenome]